MVFLTSTFLPKVQAQNYSLSMPETITVNVGETIDLLQYVTVTSGGAAAVADKLHWEFANSWEYINVENNKLTGLREIDYADLGCKLQLEGATANPLAATNVKVVRIEASAIDVKDDHREVTVNVGDVDRLTTFLNEAYQLTPANASETVRWQADNNNVSREYEYDQYQNLVTRYNPFHVGTTQMTAQVLGNTVAYESIRLQSEHTVTVHIVQPVTSLYLDTYGLNQLDCNVGNQLKTVLDGMVHVSPDDAADKSFTWSVLRGNSVAVRSDGSIQAVQSGLSLLKVTITSMYRRSSQ